MITTYHCGKVYQCISVVPLIVVEVAHGRIKVIGNLEDPEISHGTCPPWSPEQGPRVGHRPDFLTNMTSIGVAAMLVPVARYGVFRIVFGGLQVRA